MTEQKSFNDLTSRGQARRLREMALATLAEYDLPVAHVRLLTYHFNAIFRVDTEDRRRFVLRINIPGIRSKAQIRSEAQWLSALMQDTDLVVPAPVRNRNRELLTTVAVAGVPEPRHCVLFSWVPGRDLSHAMTAENYEKLGAFSASLHAHAESWEPPADFSLETHDQIFLFDTPYKFWEKDGLLDKGMAWVYEAAAVKVQQMLDELYASGAAPKVLHADLHQGNIRLYRGAMHALDFDDCLLGHFVQDVGITFYYIQNHPDYASLREGYRKGYESVLPWPENKPGQVAGQIAARELLLCQFLSTGVNPAYQAMLPRFLERALPRLEAYLDRD